MTERRWYNGKVAGTCTIVGGIAGLVGLYFAKSEWFHREWDHAWPQAQIAALLVLLVFVTTIAFVAIGRLGKSVANEAALRTELGAMRDELARAEATDSEPDQDLASADRKLLQDLRTLLPSETGSIAFARNHPFDAPYPRQALDELRTFTGAWDDADHAFHDERIDEARRGLLLAAKSFLGHLAHVSFHLPNSDEFRIYPDADLDWRQPANEYAFEAIERADELADGLWSAHQELIRIARQRVKV